MESSRRRNNKNNFEISNLDKKVDQFFEAGRQFVDGVSGTRPGSRRIGRSNRFSRANVKDMGRWITDKVDSILEDDEFEDWDYKSVNSNQFKSFRRGIDLEAKQETSLNKRPLEAKSLREINESPADKSGRLLYPVEDWPEESDFKVNKWQRATNDNQDINLQKNQIPRTPKTKSFPKSRRRRI